ncbi:MAG TPA: glycosyltransferase family 4 protein, partial [Cellvibrio sp.]
GLRKLLKTLRAHFPYFSADSAIGATEYVKQRLIDINCFPAMRCFSAPNGLPPLTTRIEPIDLHAQLALHKDTLFIVSTGRATLYKGVDFALDVIAQLIHGEQISNIHYLYCGDGPDLQLLQTKATTLGIEKQVTFLGRVNNIDSILAGCNIAFHPSKGEVGYSLSILEYMRAGLPVVISNNPSVCEAITHHYDGLVYSEGDITSAVDVFKELLADKNQRNLLGLHGKETVQNKYSLSNTHQALIRALESTMGI